MRNKPMSYIAQFDTRTVLRGARFVGSEGAEMEFRCCAGAEGNCAVFKPATGNDGLFYPEELRELSFFLNDLADRIEHGEEVEF